MESLEEKLRKKQEETQQQKEENERTKQAKALSLKEMLEKKKKADQEKQEQEIREQIIAKGQELEEAQKKIEEINAPRSSEVFGEELKKQNEELQKIEGELQRATEELEKIFVSYKALLEESGVKRAEEMLDHEEYTDTPEVQAIKNLTKLQVQKVLERDQVQNKKIEAEKDEAQLPSREEHIQMIQEQMVQIGNQIHELKEQLPEAREKKKQEAIEIIKTMLPQASDIRGYTSEVQQVCAQMISGPYKNISKEYEKIRDSYGEEELGLMWKEAMRQKLLEIPVLHDLERDKHILQKMEYSPEEIRAVEKAGEDLAKKTKKVQQILKDQFALLEKEDPSFGHGWEKDENYLVNQYFYPASFIVNTQYWGHGFNTGEVEVQQFVERIVGDIKSENKQFDMQKIIAYMGRFDKILEEIEQVHINGDQTSPIHCKNFFGEDHEEMSKKLKRLWMAEYPLLKLGIKEEGQIPKVLQKVATKISKRPMTAIPETLRAIEAVERGLVEYEKSLDTMANTIVHVQQLESELKALEPYEGSTVPLAIEEMLKKKKAAVRSLEMLERKDLNLSLRKDDFAQKAKEKHVKMNLYLGYHLTVLDDEETAYENIVFEINKEIAKIEQEILVSESYKPSMMDKLFRKEKEQERLVAQEKLRVTLTELKNKGKSIADKLDEERAIKKYIGNWFSRLDDSLMFNKKLIEDLKDKEMTVEALYNKIHLFYSMEKDREIPTELKMKHDAIETLRSQLEKIKKDRSVVSDSDISGTRTLQKSIEYIS